MPSPYVDSTPPPHILAAWKAARTPAVRPADPARGISPDAVWTANPLSGTRTLSVGGVKFRIPRGAEVKRSGRAATTWVHFENRTYVFSELGCLEQSDATRRSVPWDAL